MKILLVLIVAVLLAGCTLDLGAASWKKRDTFAPQVTADEYACAHDAFRIGPGLDLVLGGLLDVLRLAGPAGPHASAFARCRTSEAYPKGPPQARAASARR